MTERLPLFPLNTVLYPGLVLPLNVFEERYRRLVADLLALPEDQPRRFGVLAIKDGREVAPVRPDDGPAGPLNGLGTVTGDPLEALHHIGCVADLTSVQPQPDGRYELLVTGTTRFRLRSADTGGPYLTGEAEPIEERTGEGSGALASEVERAFRTYQKRLAGAREASTVGRQELPDDPQVLSYLVAAATVLETPLKQKLLASPDNAQRLRLELDLLRRETAVLGWLPSLPAADLTRQSFSPN
ncbi:MULTISPECIES: LON peptidase substrate-binding domain-containing protein [unclassified Streptomyces]|uniref:LON peptidase substrate-binding domain-containing protein n=1 Tax=Streptomycetaceae TaxID=2062 RepID=UPI002E76A324|nr:MULTISPECIES: LON peptidase substrate-binding domain-containing protein [unclassified Streptomyces]MED7954118.1 LON peptidase substrate-binding domain-containing protein [Streptomyces sp. BE303]MEE1825933.1 LON peptidase substrate-binding domain-containing protein [Streptomyces sp. BE20]